MALFDIPGWSLSAPPVAESSQQVSKKRKRPSSDAPKLQSAEINLEKLVKRLKNRPVVVDNGPTQSSKGGSKRIEKERKKKGKTLDATEFRKKTISRPKALKPAEKGTRASPPPAKKRKRSSTETQSPSVLPKKGEEGSTAAGLTILQKNMKQSLDGARFRIINESLYTINSHEAFQMIQDDSKVYEDYHTGFRHQVQKWPTNPVEHYTLTLSTYPPKTVIADLGCGDAAIARSLIPKGMTVLSFDLMSDGMFVVEADTCNRIPLPGSEGSEDENSVGEGHVVDVVICALSLMGTNWPNCLREAWRILKKDGELKIAEVASRFTDMEEFQNLVCSIGFKMKLKDDSNSHFTLFEFRKTARKPKSEKEWGKVLSRAGVLKPCEYKRR